VRLDEVERALEVEQLFNVNAAQRLMGRSFAML
jgi:hypothetical protein